MQELKFGLDRFGPQHDDRLNRTMQELKSVNAAHARAIASCLNRTMQELKLLRRTEPQLFD